MKLFYTLTAGAVALCLGAGVAHAQLAPQRPGQPPSDTGPANPSATARDTNELDIMRDRDEANRRKMRKAPVAATREQLTIGSGVHDLAGQELGTIASVTEGGAVISSTVGKVEVPLEAFGTDGKTLMIAMPKADFDAAVAAANGG